MVDMKLEREFKHLLPLTAIKANPALKGMQLVQREDGKVGDAYHIIDGSTILLDKGYHPCVVAPGYEMYYFTILGGLSQRGLKQHFQPTHAGQLHTIPGILDMVAKFR